MLKFNDGANWFSKRVAGVIHAYKMPEDVNGVCVDVGANVGAFAHVNNKKFDKLFLIEPASETYDKCVMNIDRYPNVTVYNLAVSSKSDETIKLRHYKDQAFSGNATTLDDSDWYREGEYEEIKTIALKDMYDRFEIDKINYLKVDCEGGEYDFLINEDLSNVDYIGIEIHIQLGDKANELMEHIGKTHEIINQSGDGKKMHFEITYKNINK